MDNNLFNKGNCNVASSKATSICYSKAENFISKLKAAKNNCDATDPCYISFDGLSLPSALAQDPGPSYDSEEISSAEVTVYCYKADDTNASKFETNYNGKLHLSDSGVSKVTLPAGSYKSIIYFINKTEAEKEAEKAEVQSKLNDIAKEVALSSLVCYTGNNELTLTCPATVITGSVTKKTAEANTFINEIELVDDGTGKMEAPTQSVVDDYFNSATIKANAYLLSTLKCLYGNAEQTVTCEGVALSGNGYENTNTIAADYISGIADFSEINPADTEAMAKSISVLETEATVAANTKKGELNTSAKEIASAALSCNYGNDAKTYICGSDGFKTGTYPIYFDNKGIAKRNYVDVAANVFVASTKDEANALAKEFAASSLDNCGYYSNKIEMNCDLGGATSNASLQNYLTAKTALENQVADNTSENYVAAVTKVKAIINAESSTTVEFNYTYSSITDGEGEYITCKINGEDFSVLADAIKSQIAEVIYSSFYPSSIIRIPQTSFNDTTLLGVSIYYDNPNTIFFLYNNNHVIDNVIRVANTKSSIRNSSLNYGDMSSIVVNAYNNQDIVNASALSLALSSISCMYGNKDIALLTCVELQEKTNVCASGLLYPAGSVHEDYNKNGDAIAAETYVADSPNNADSIAITVQKASMICPCSDWGGGGGGTSISVSATSNCTSCGDCAVFKS